MARRITDIVTEGEALGVVAGVAASVPVPETAADVAFTPAGDLVATDVQAALEELDTDKSPTTHTHDAADVAITDAGGYFTGTDVEAALQELGASGGGGGGALDLFHVRDEKATSTAGGTFTSGAWQTRTLNTTKTNEIASAALASNQLSLPAGTYEVEASAPAYQVNFHQTRLQNITAGTTLVLGQTSVAGAATAASTFSAVRGRFTLGATSTVELQHRCSTTAATTGFGNAAGFGTEVYAEVLIRKIS